MNNILTINQLIAKLEDARAASVLAGAAVVHLCIQNETYIPVADCKIENDGDGGAVCLIFPKWEPGDSEKRVKERWVFSAKELRNPGACRRDDEFLADVGDMDDVRGIIVDRSGKASNRYSDGIRGVTPEDKEMAEDQQSLTRWVGYETSTYAADLWMDVWTNEDGAFLEFAEPRSAE